MFGLDLFKRDPVLRKDREISNSVDFRRLGGPDRRSSFAPTGNILDPNTGASVGQTYKPCPPESFNDISIYDFNQALLTAFNGAYRLSVLAIGSLQVTPEVRAFAEITYATAKDHFDAHTMPDFFSVPIIDPSQRPFEDPANQGTVLIGGRFMHGGPRMIDRKSDALNVAIGADGLNFGLDWKVAVGHGESKVTNRDQNYCDATLWAPASASGRLDPTINTNDPAFVNSLKVRPVRTGMATVDYINLQVRGDLFKLPAGKLRYAVGLAFLRESLSDQPDPLSQAGNVIGGIGQAVVDASRSSRGRFFYVNAQYKFW